MTFSFQPPTKKSTTRQGTTRRIVSSMSPWPPNSRATLEMQGRIPEVINESESFHAPDSALVGQQGVPRRSSDRARAGSRHRARPRRRRMRVPRPGSRRRFFICLLCGGNRKAVVEECSSKNSKPSLQALPK